MPKFLQVTLEFSLEGLSDSGFPIVLLRNADRLRFLRQDAFGFQVSYAVPKAEVPEFQERHRNRYDTVVGGKLLVSVRGPPGRINHMFAKFDERKVPHRVAKLTEVEN